jgi:hypothetical protein
MQSLLLHANDYGKRITIVLFKKSSYFPAVVKCHKIVPRKGMAVLSPRALNIASGAIAVA